jgi:hypothetical protein
VDPDADSAGADQVLTHVRLRPTAARDGLVFEEDELLHGPRKSSRNEEPFALADESLVAVLVAARARNLSELLEDVNLDRLERVQGLSNSGDLEIDASSEPVSFVVTDEELGNGVSASAFIEIPHLQDQVTKFGLNIEHLSFDVRVIERDVDLDDFLRKFATLADVHVDNVDAKANLPSPATPSSSFQDLKGRAHLFEGTLNSSGVQEVLLLEPP